MSEAECECFCSGTVSGGIKGLTVVVLNEQWIYSRQSDAEQVPQRCQPDHDDEFKCWYRVRAINSYEASCTLRPN